MLAFSVPAILFLANKYYSKMSVDQVDRKLSTCYINPLGIISAICALFIVYYYYLYYGRIENLLPHNDMSVYSSAAFKHFKFGESNSPYHYFDMWLISLGAKLFSCLYLKSELIIALPLLASLFSFGMVCIARKSTRNKTAIIASAFAGFVSFPLLSYHPISQTLAANLQVKTLVGAVYIAWAYRATQERSRNWFLPLLVLPL